MASSAGNNAHRLIQSMIDDTLLNLAEFEVKESSEQGCWRR